MEFYFCFLQSYSAANRDLLVQQIQVLNIYSFSREKIRTTREYLGADIGIAARSLSSTIPRDHIPVGNDIICYTKSKHFIN